VSAATLNIPDAADQLDAFYAYQAFQGFENGALFLCVSRKNMDRDTGASSVAGQSQVMSEYADSCFPSIAEVHAMEKVVP